MDESQPQRSSQVDRLGRFWRSARIGLIVGLSVLAAFSILYFDLLPTNRGVSLSAGEVASQDILAPRPVTYASQVLTEEAKDAAARAVPDVYDPPDARVARQQVEKLRAALEFIDSVRADTVSTREQKVDDLQQLQGIAVEPTVAGRLLDLAEADWERIKAEAVSVLEQVMRDQVREDRAEDVRRTVPVLVSLELPEPHAEIASRLAQDFIAPNSFYSEAATLEARQEARDAVPPVSQSFVTGQTVVQRGRVVTQADIEALAALGLIRQSSDWHQLLQVSLIVLLATAILIAFARQFHPELTAGPRRVLLFCLLFLLFLLGAKVMVPGHAVLPYLVPTAALAMMIAVVYGPHLAITTAVIMGGMMAYIGGNSFELAVFTVSGCVMAALALGQADRMNSFFWAGLAAAAAEAATILIFRVPDRSTDSVGIAMLVGASLINGGASASLTLALFFVVGTLFDVTTSLQLVELSRPNHPLLQFMLREAPGSYQHSLQVGSLAEQAAEEVGANALLVRVGALYHDVGKAMHPEFFVENQLNGNNIHERLDPKTSAQIIIGHVKDGVEMARRHRLPSRVRNFIPEHHGTLRTNFQYKRALDAAGSDASKVDEASFHYPGPRPQTKETALLMLADGCEAKVRSDRPSTVEDLERIVKYVIDDRLSNGQLDDTGLTLNDLKVIRQSFVTTLKGMFHARIQYPELPAEPAGEPEGLVDAAPAAGPKATG